MKKNKKAWPFSDDICKNNNEPDSWTSLETINRRKLSTCG